MEGRDGGERERERWSALGGSGERGGEVGDDGCVENEKVGHDESEELGVVEEFGLGVEERERKGGTKDQFDVRPFEHEDVRSRHQKLPESSCSTRFEA